jgi:hypothetical protein
MREREQQIGAKLNIRSHLAAATEVGLTKSYGNSMALNQAGREPGKV